MPFSLPLFYSDNPSSQPVMTVQQRLLTNFFKPRSAREAEKRRLTDVQTCPVVPTAKKPIGTEADAKGLKQETKVPEVLEHGPDNVVLEDPANVLHSRASYKFTGFDSKSSPVITDRSTHEKFEAHFSGRRKRFSTSTEESSNKRTHKFKLTPLEKQFVDLKKDNMDKVLAVQVGYKYKFFGHDAQIASKALNIMFIPGRVSIDVEHASAEEQLYDRFAYCSIPDNRLHVHLKRLIHKGLKIGVVDQKETAIMKQNSGTGSKLFERKITKVYTAGTYIDDSDETLKGNDGKSIVCLRESPGNADELNIVSVNAYCAEIIWDSFTDHYTRSSLETRLLHLEPIEILTVGELSEETRRCIKGFRRSLRGDQDQLRLLKVSPVTVNEYLTALDGYELSGEAFAFISQQKPSLLSCFCELISYLSEFGLTPAFRFLSHYKNFSDAEKSMILDANTIRNLEVFRNLTTGTEDGSLFWILDHTSTPFGRRHLRRWVSRPLNDREKIMERSGAVESIAAHFKSLAIERVLQILKHCPDLEISLSKIHYGRSRRREVYLFLRKMNDVFDAFENLRPELVDDAFESQYLIQIYHEVKEIAKSDLVDFRNLFKMIYSPAAIDEKDEEAHVVKFFNSQFYDYHRIKQHFDDVSSVEESLEKVLKGIGESLNRPHVKFITNNGEPYLIEVRNTQVKKVPRTWLKINGTKSVSRFRTPEVVDLYKSWLYHKECLRQECNECFKGFVNRIDGHFTQLNKVISQLATLDCLFSLTVASSATGTYTRPQLLDAPMISFVNARNPVAETLKANYIPNSFSMGADSGRVAIITGPNMGGKSSFIRQIALIVIMAQVGCYIPADGGSKLGVVDAIYVRIGAYDDIFKGQSTFQVEMSECSSILSKCTERSLVLLDEIGRGTSSVDGCSIAYSILDYLCYELKPLVLFITHFQNLHVFEKLTKGIAKNYHLGFQNHGDDLFFTYKLTEGPSERSYGVHCAMLAGMPKEITELALQASSELEKRWDSRRARSVAHATKEAISSSDFRSLWHTIDEYE
ncbi:DEKNAAC100595 [Brettanomyces naardenensis]|uniref:DNA mismatch repair protein MSH3 n=1 Tax=Brettanomyces naardenensis TaxID=13370 RepID=A0A448YG32_BRENA|nr:DEKNAAC100595 [Brettanomyces naardenensis]